MSTDVFSPEKRSAVMRRVKGRDTSPEIAVRRMLRAAGIGYRLGGPGLPGRPDIVMQGRRTVVFVRTAEGTFMRHRVEIGHSFEGFTEVYSGIKLGDVVVTEGSFILKSEFAKASLGEEQ